jgi:ligand-binding sensor domain-containing protein
VTCIGLFLFLLAKVIQAQYRVTNFDYTHGLPVSGISDFAEDSLGYIWMGSNNGLVRFDGLEFKYFEPSREDSNSIFGSEVADIDVDASGKVWVTFHDGGISVFNHSTGVFKSRYKGGDDLDNFSTTALINIYIDDELGKIWGVSSEGLFKIDMKTFKSEKVYTGHKLIDLIEDPTDSNYLFLGGDILRRIHKHDHQVKVVEGASFYKIRADGHMLYGHDWSGYVVTYDLETKAINKYPTPDDFLNRGIIIKGNEYWLASYNGVYTFDKSTGNRSYLSGDHINGFINRHLFGIYRDSYDRIWMGTDTGLSVIIPEYQFLKQLKSPGITRYNDLVKGSGINRYYTTSLYDNVLAEIDVENDKTSVITKAEGDFMQGPMSIVRASDKIWVLGFKGFGYFTDHEKVLKKFDGQQFDNLLQKEDLGKVVLDAEDRLWVKRKSSNTLISISPDRNTIDTVIFNRLGPEDKIQELHFDGKALWLGTHIGVCRYDPVLKKKTWFLEEDPRYKVFQYTIEAINTDSEGFTWVLATQHGAWKCKYDALKDDLVIIRGYHQTDGLANNRPWDIDVDDRGTIYFGSTSGLSIYNKVNERMVSYGKEYGFDLLALHTKYLDNKLFIFSRGLAFFEINDLYQDRTPPEVNIQSVKASGNSEKLLTNLEASKRYKFNYDNNNLIFNFLTVELDRPRDISYRYRIQEDDHWTITDYSTREVNYYELPPGDYTFEVSAAFKDLLWGPVNKISFVINPPFWKTWWFRLMAIVSLGTIIYAFIKWRENQIRLLGNMRNRMTELENEALRAQMNPHFIFNSLNSIKSFIIRNQKEEAADYLTTFAELIRKILRNSKSELIPLAEEIDALELYMEIENIRLEDKFDVIWHIDEEIKTEGIMVPPLTLQPFVENAIWHGFIHKEGKGELNIRISKHEDYLNVSIKDNGIGREKSKEIEKKHFRKRSFGIAITQQRLGYQHKLKNNIEIIDLYNDENTAIGTEVKLQIPCRLISDLSVIS